MGNGPRSLLLGERVGLEESGLRRTLVGPSPCVVSDVSFTPGSLSGAACNPWVETDSMSSPDPDAPASSSFLSRAGFELQSPDCLLDAGV